MASLVLNGSWSTKLIKYHGLNAFSRKQLNKLITPVVLLCPLKLQYSIKLYAIFKKHNNNQNGLCVHFPARAQAIHIFLLAQAEVV